MGNTRDITFDIMKGVGIILVMIGHVWPPIPYAHHTIASFHMPMFFIVAGYFSKGFVDRQSAWQSVKHFFNRLCVPAFLTQLAIALWSVLNKYAKGVSWNSVIREFLSLFWADAHGPVTPWGKLSIGVTWFLLALFISKCLLLLLSRLKVWAILASFALSIGAVLLFDVFPYSIWCIGLGLTALPFVTIGWWFRNHKIPVWLLVIGIVCWILAIFYSKMDMYDFNYGCYPIDALGACGGTFCFYLLCKGIGKMKDLKVFGCVPKLFAYLGTISLIIMCVHCFEISAHLGAHTAALIHVKFSVAGMYVFRYLLTICIAVVIAMAYSILSRFKRIESR